MPLQFTAEPQNVIATVGSDFSFSPWVWSGGVAPYSIQLFHNGVQFGGDSLIAETTTSLSIGDSTKEDFGSYQLSVTSGSETILSRFVVVSEPYTYETVSIPEGDPKLFLTASGVDIRFENGLPIMENGLENIVAISLFTEQGYALNRIAPNSDTEIGSTFLEESRKSITKNQLSIIEDSAEKALSWAVESGIFSEVSAKMVYGGSTGYILTITVTPPTGQQQQLSFIRNGENWIEQQKKS